MTPALTRREGQPPDVAARRTSWRRTAEYRCSPGAYPLSTGLSRTSIEAGCTPFLGNQRGDELGLDGDVEGQLRQADGTP
jgi:hypothetical protein